MSFTETCQRIVRDPCCHRPRRATPWRSPPKTRCLTPSCLPPCRMPWHKGAVRHVRGTRSPQTALCAAGLRAVFAPGLGLAGAGATLDFDEALDALRILYHHVPSVTGMPVWLGRLDHLLLPFVGELDDETLYRKLKGFWIYLDRVLPDAFMHVNIGPDDNRICRLILRIDNELQQVAPNLTFLSRSGADSRRSVAAGGEEYRRVQQAAYRQLPGPSRYLRPTRVWHRQLLQRPAAGRWRQHPGAHLPQAVAEQAQGIDDFLGASAAPLLPSSTSQLIAVRAAFPARGVRFLRQLPGGGGTAG